jgi:hypothetical protein
VEAETYKTINKTLKFFIFLIIKFIVFFELA